MCLHVIALAIWWTLTKAYQGAGPGYSSQVYKVRTYTIPPLELDLVSLMQVEHPWSSEWKESNHGWAMCLCPFKKGLIDSDQLGLAWWIWSWENVSRQGHFFLWLKQLFLWKNPDSENRREDNKNSHVREKNLAGYVFFTRIETREKIWLVHVWVKDFKSCKLYNSGCYEEIRQMAQNWNALM